MQYFDGLGRALQNVQVFASPGKKDLISMAAYDIAGRPYRQYLPYEDSGSSYGSYRSGAIAAQASFYNSPPNGVVQITEDSGITPSYSESEYWPSPLNQMKEQGATGYEWHLKLGGSTIKNEEVLNTSTDSVRLWNISGNSCSTSSYYVPGDLFKKIHKDENTYGQEGSAEEFTDKQGRTILKRSWLNSTTAYDTYYIYDVMGNLRYVVPPEPQPAASAKAVQIPTLLNLFMLTAMAIKSCW